MTDPRLFDIDGAVTYFAGIGAPVSRNFVRELISNGGIKHLKLGRKFYVSQTAINEWLERSERRAKA